MTFVCYFALNLRFFLTAKLKYKLLMSCSYINSNFFAGLQHCNSRE